MRQSQNAVITQPSDRIYLNRYKALFRTNKLELTIDLPDIADAATMDLGHDGESSKPCPMT